MTGRRGVSILGEQVADILFMNSCLLIMGWVGTMGSSCSGNWSTQKNENPAILNYSPIKGLDSGLPVVENENGRQQKADPDTADFLPSFPAAFAEVAGAFFPRIATLAEAAIHSGDTGSFWFLRLFSATLRFINL